MLEQRIENIEPNEETHFLVGPEGLVWTQPAIGEPVIIAANSEENRKQAAAFIWSLLNMGLVPYGMPLTQREIVALFGGSPLRDCRWVHHTKAPEPTGDDGDTLPTQAAIVLSNSSRGERTKQLEEFAKQMLIDNNFDINTPVDLKTLAPIMANEMGCHIETARRHLSKAARRLRGEDVASRGGKREGAGRPPNE